MTWCQSTQHQLTSRVPRNSEQQQMIFGLIMHRSLWTTITNSKKQYLRTTYKSIQMKSIEQTILKNLLVNEAYARKVMAFLLPEYVQNRNERLLLEEIKDYIQKYNQLPSKTAIELELQKRTNLHEDDFKATIDIITSLDKDPD